MTTTAEILTPNMGSMMDNTLESAFDRHLEQSISHPTLKHLKQQGWEAFKSLPMPTRMQETWRFANLSTFSLEGFQLPSAPDTALAADIISRSTLVNTYAGRHIFANDTQIGADPISDELKQQGVIWESLEEAWNNHPELLEDYFLKLSTQLGSEKFQALHQAYCRSGSVLFVPANVEIKEPLVTYHWAAGAHVAIFPHTLIIAEANSRVDVVDFYFSADSNEPALSSSVAHVYTGPGARVFRKTAQCFNTETFSFQIEKNIAQRDSEIKTVAMNLGCARARLENQIHIEGAGSNVKIGSLTVANGNQEFDQRTLQVHDAPNAVSDLLYKNALLEDAKTIFSGLIRVAKEGQKTDAYQTNRNLLLSKTAEAVSLPGLEIEANDVKCSHGATTGQIDAAERFYLASRGIPKEKAEELIVFGFFEEVIEYFENEELADSLRQLIRKKFHQG